jgi:hypothetical protein
MKRTYRVMSTWRPPSLMQQVHVSLRPVVEPDNAEACDSMTIVLRDAGGLEEGKIYDIIFTLAPGQ